MDGAWIYSSFSFPCLESAGACAHPASYCNAERQFLSRCLIVDSNKRVSVGELMTYEIVISGVLCSEANPRAPYSSPPSHFRVQSPTPPCCAVAWPVPVAVEGDRNLLGSDWRAGGQREVQMPPPLQQQQPSLSRLSEQ